jgi:hypothetical protein
MIEQIEVNNIDFQELTLINHAGNKFVHLKGMQMEMTIYENLFLDHISGTILIAEAVDLSDILPVIGEETLVIKFKSSGIPNRSKTNSYIFSVYKVTKREKLEERMEGYVIHFVSKENIINLKSESTAGYVGKTIKDIVNKEYETHFLDNEDTHGKNIVKYLSVPTPIELDETEGLHSFVGNKSNPLEFINYLSSQAKSNTYPESDYVFYRDRIGYKFKTISSLIDQEPVESYYLADPNVADSKDIVEPDPVRKYQIIYDLKHTQSPETAKRIETGIYDNEVLSIDPLTKQFTQKTFSYYWDYTSAGFTNLSNFGIMSPYSIHETTRAPYHTRMLAVDSKKQDYTYMENKTGDNNISYPKTRQDFLNMRIVKNGLMDYSAELEIVIPGDNLRTVGQVINIFIPVNYAHEKLKNQYNLLFTEKVGSDQITATFLITKVVHKYNQLTKQYVTKLTCIKDSYGSSISSMEKVDKDLGDIWT